MNVTNRVDTYNNYAYQYAPTQPRTTVQQDQQAQAAQNVQNQQQQAQQTQNAQNAQSTQDQQRKTARQVGNIIDVTA
jgi:hypothetical protein